MKSVISKRTWDILKFWGAIMVVLLLTMSIVSNVILFKRLKKSLQVKTELKYQQEIDSLKASLTRTIKENEVREKALLAKIEAYRETLGSKQNPVYPPKKFYYIPRNELNLLLQDAEKHRNYKFLTDSLK